MTREDQSAAQMWLEIAMGDSYPLGYTLHDCLRFASVLIADEKEYMAEAKDDAREATAIVCAMAEEFEDRLH
jgi:hypothetical protein